MSGTILGYRSFRSRPSPTTKACWSACDPIVYPDHRSPVWDEEQAGYVDPDSEDPVPRWQKGSTQRPNPSQPAAALKRTAPANSTSTTALLCPGCEATRTNIGQRQAWEPNRHHRTDDLVRRMSSSLPAQTRKLDGQSFVRGPS